MTWRMSWKQRFAQQNKQPASAFVSALKVSYPKSPRILGKCQSHIFKCAMQLLNLYDVIVPDMPLQVT
eukprot:1602190-Karenia_brevis.AAC.1